jgi:hypothetical protein
MQDLGTLSAFPSGQSWASSINNSGEIVGRATRAGQGQNVEEGVAVWEGGQIRELPFSLGKSREG